MTRVVYTTAFTAVNSTVKIFENDVILNYSAIYATHNPFWFSQNVHSKYSVVSHFRVVQTQAILFLKSMSEKVGSDIERRWFLNDESLDRLRIDWGWRHSNSKSFYIGCDSFRHWFGCGLPLKLVGDQAHKNSYSKHVVCLVNKTVKTRT